MILGPEVTDRLDRSQTGTDNSPRTKFPGKGEIGVDGLMGAVKCTETDMQDTGLQHAAIIAGPI